MEEKKETRPLKTDEDMELVHRFKEGQLQAFDEIVERYREKLTRLIYGFVGTKSDTEDLLQEVFLRAYRNLSRFRGESSLYTWMYRIALNICRNHLRRNKRFLPLTETRFSKVEEAYEDTEKGVLLRKMMEKLPWRQKQVLVLKYFQNLTINEIALTLRCSPNTVKVHLYRAISGLRRIMRKMGVEEWT